MANMVGGQVTQDLATQRDAVDLSRALVLGRVQRGGKDLVMVRYPDGRIEYVDAARLPNAQVGSPVGGSVPVTPSEELMQPPVETAMSYAPETSLRPRLNPRISTQGSTEAPPVQEVPAGSYVADGRGQIAKDVYSAFRGAGFSDAQSRALTGEINRENSLDPRYLFGSHLDPYNKATNVGMLSWQGARAPKVMEFLAERGLVTDQGTIVPGYEALQAQAEYIRKEMEETPDYAETVDIFLSNPDVDPETARRVLGDNYIRWRRTDPRYQASGYARIAEGYDLLAGRSGDDQPTGGPSSNRLASEELSSGGSEQNLASEELAGERYYGMFGDEYASPSERTKADAEMLKESKVANRMQKYGDSLDYLADALEYLDLSQIAKGPKMPSSVGPGVYRPQRGSGTKALQRFGIASLA